MCVCVRTGVGCDSRPAGTHTLSFIKKDINILLMSSPFQLRGKEETLTEGVCFRVNSSKLHTHTGKHFLTSFDWFLGASNHAESYGFA